MSSNKKAATAPAIKGGTKMVTLSAAKKESIRALAAAVKGYNVKQFIAGAIAVIVLCLMYFTKEAAASLALLYIYADNGKKSGRADGNVYMRNGRVRGFKVPSLVRNPATGFARANLATWSQSWNDLTEEQRLTWNNASGVFDSDRFGRPVEIKGKNLYVRCNQILTYNGGSQVFEWVPDASTGILTFLGGTADVSASEMNIVFDNAPIETDVAITLFATAPQKAGIYRPSQSAYRFITSQPATTASPFDMWAAYVTKFGAPAAGQKVFVRAYKSSVLSGMRTAYQDTNFIVQA